ncbi:MAG: hypothetical protein IPQ18_11245 [Saprospiraceae bacterium]|nr:hypothetical protein [Saprospiraceae bacterium]
MNIASVDKTMEYIPYPCIVNEINIPYETIKLMVKRILKDFKEVSVIRFLMVSTKRIIRIKDTHPLKAK